MNKQQASFNINTQTLNLSHKHVFSILSFS